MVFLRASLKGYYSTLSHITNKSEKSDRLIVSDSTWHYYNDNNHTVTKQTLEYIADHLIILSSISNANRYKRI